MLFISNIQHFSVGDGDGIRTTVFFQGCPLRCPWCHNPEAIPDHPVTLQYRATGKNAIIGKTETKGKYITAEELLPELMEDFDFYVQSGGGVTFSGGEVLRQPEGAAQLARLLHERGVAVLVDTAGNVPYEAFETVDPFVDGYLYDYKSGSKEKYRDIIGGSLDLVTDNLARLLKAGKNVRIRIPLIPGFNTDEDSVETICRNLKQLSIREVDLLPFHRLATAKYEAMGLTYAYKDVAPMTPEELGAIEKEYGAYFVTHVEK